MYLSLIKSFPKSRNQSVNSILAIVMSQNSRFSRKTLTWLWRHQMGTFSALLFDMYGESSAHQWFPHKGTGKRNVDIYFFLVWINGRTNTPLTPWRSFDVNVMITAAELQINAQRTVHISGSHTKNIMFTEYSCTSALNIDFLLGWNSSFINMIKAGLVCKPYMRRNENLNQSIQHLSKVNIFVPELSFIDNVHNYLVTHALSTISLFHVGTTKK